MRPDLIDLIRAYNGFCDALLIASLQPCAISRHRYSAPTSLCWHRGPPQCGLRLRQLADGLNIFRDAIEASDEVILTNDSFWGPVRPLRSLFEKLKRTDADAIGLTDDLMYEHICNRFISYRRPAWTTQAFMTWNGLKAWDSKPDIIKRCEVGLTAKLASEGLNLRRFTPINRMAMCCITTGNL